MTRKAAKNDPSTANRRVLYALARARGLTITAASEAAGISRASGTRYERDADVAALASDFRRRIASECVGRLATAGSEAVTRLVELTRSEDGQTALGACKCLLSFMSRIADAHGEQIYTRPIPLVRQPSTGIDFDVHAMLGDLSSTAGDIDYPDPPQMSSSPSADARAMRAYESRCDSILDASLRQRERDAEQAARRQEYENHQRRGVMEADAAEDG